MMRLKPKQIWFHRDPDGEIDKILYVVEPSWHGNAAWCRTKNSHGVVADEDYNPEELIGNRDWKLASPYEMFNNLCAHCFDVDIEKPQHYFEVLFSDSSHSECIRNAADWHDTKDALYVYDGNDNAIAMFYKNNVRRIIVKGRNQE